MNLPYTFQAESNVVATGISTRQPAHFRATMVRLGAVLLLSLIFATSVWLVEPSQLYAQTGILYVASGGSDAGNTCTQSFNPCLSIQHAIDEASNGAEIRVATGSYTSTIVNKNVTLSGGYQTTNWVDFDPVANPTTISGGGTSRALQISNGAVATIQGFHITGGNLNDNGAGVLVTGASTFAILRDNEIYNNQINGATVNGAGVAIIGTAAGAELINNKIYNNTATNASALGGGVALFSTAILRGNEIYDNVAGLGGGGIYIASSLDDITLENNIFYNNEATDTSNDAGGGAVYIFNFGDNVVDMQNNTFYDNRGRFGGAIRVYTGTLSINNSVFDSNDALGNQGEAIYVGNLFNTTEGALTFSYSDFSNHTSPVIFDTDGNVDVPIGGTNNTVANPFFANAPAGDLRLSSGSPAIDAGFDNGLTEDFEGRARPFGTDIDRGASEFITVDTCYARIEDGQVFVGRAGLQTAVQTAAPNSLIKVAGECTGFGTVSSVNQTLYISQSLTIRGGYDVTDWETPQYGGTLLDAGATSSSDDASVIRIPADNSISIVLENLRITGGHEAQNGGGIAIGQGASVSIVNSFIYDNIAETNGGGIYKERGGTLIIDHSTIASNEARGSGFGIGGGGIFGSAPGALPDGGQIVIRNSIIVDNQAPNGEGGGIRVEDDANIILQYNNVADNTASTDADYSGTAAINASQDGTSISVSPSFVAPGSGDYRLDTDAAEINRADPNSTITTDIDNQPRPLANRADMGADESVSYTAIDLAESPDSPQVITALIPQNTPIEFTHAVTNLGTLGTDTFDIIATNNENFNISYSDTSITLDQGETGFFTVTVEPTLDLTSTRGIINRTFITVTSQSNSSTEASVTDVIAPAGAEFAPDYDTFAPPGDVFTYTHFLTNTGAAADFTISFVSSLGGATWVEAYTPTMVTLDTDESIPVLVRVRVLTSAEAGVSDVVTVTASGTVGAFNFDNEVVDKTTATAVTGPRFVGAGYATSSDNNNNCIDLNRPCATIQKALAQASAGDPISVAAPGPSSPPNATYQLPSGLRLDNIELRGGYADANFTNNNRDASLTVLEPQAANTRGFEVGNNSVLEYFTMQNFNVGFAGGALLVRGTGSITISNMIFQDVTATQGAAIAVETGNPYISRSQINNTAGEGAILVLGGSPTFDEITIENASSSSGRGGGVLVNSGQPLFRGIVITNATASTNGGGFYINAGSVVRIEDSTVYSSTAVNGTGIYNAGGTLTVENMEIHENEAIGGRGGGIFMSSGTTTISRTRVYSNTANSGGGINQTGGTLNLWNNYIYQNEAVAGGGGGIAVSGGSHILLHNTLYDNTASTIGGGLFESGTVLLELTNNIFASNQANVNAALNRSGGGTLINDYNLYFDNISNIGGDTNITKGANSLTNTDPQFDSPGAGDFGLPFSSPAVDTGNPARTINRDIDEDLRPSGQAPDIGANELAGCLVRVASAPNILYGVIQDAIDAASGGDEIQIHGTCRGVATKTASNNDTVTQVVYVNKNLLLSGGWDADFSNQPTVSPEPTFIDAQSNGRVIYVDKTATDDTTTVSMQYLTLINGDAVGQGGDTNGDAGGGIYNNNNVINIRARVVISGNQAEYGGGIYHRNTDVGTLRITMGEDDTVTIQNNTASENGGGIYISSIGLPVIQRAQVINNTADGNGGGVYFELDGNYTVITSTFSANSANNGGAIYNTTAPDVTIINSEIRDNNTANNNGGGIYNRGTMYATILTVQDSMAGTNGRGGGIYNEGILGINRGQILTNTVTGPGGGIYNTSAATLWLTNTIVAFNVADVGGALAGDGGGVFNQSNNLTIWHSAFYDNNAFGGEGGAIYNNNLVPSGIINSSVFDSNNDGGTNDEIFIANDLTQFAYNNMANNGSTAINFDIFADPFTTNNQGAPAGFISTDPGNADFLRIDQLSALTENGDPSSPVTDDIDGKPRPANQNFDIGVSEVGDCFVYNRRTAQTFGQIQQAINTAQDGDDLLLAGECIGVDENATPPQAVLIDKPINLIGGFRNGFWLEEPQPITYVTTINAADLGRVIYVNASGVVSITGLTLTGGFVDNTIDSGNENGGGVYVESGTVYLTNNIITRNNVSLHGGGVYVESGTVIISDDVYDDDRDNEGLLENTAQSGGAVYHAGGTTTIDTVNIRNNTADDGGAIYYANAGTMVIVNNLMVGNDAEVGNGGAVYVQNTPGSESFQLVNNTLYENEADTGGRHLYVAGGNPYVRNNVFADDAATAVSPIGADVAFVVQYNYVQPGLSGDPDVTAGTGYQTGPPLDNYLEDPQDGNFDLTPNSPLIDAGIDYAANNFANGGLNSVTYDDPDDLRYLRDYKDTYRPGDQTFDIGASERASCPAEVASSGQVFGNLQRAILEASAVDTIYVAVGGCRGVSNGVGGLTDGQTIYIDGKNLTILGGYSSAEELEKDGPPINRIVLPITYDGNPDSPSATSLLPIDPNNNSQGRALVLINNATVRIERINIAFGEVDNDGGGAIYVQSGSKLRLEGVDFYTNTVTNNGNGGAIYNAGVMTITTDSTFDNNTAPGGNGGAIYNAQNAVMDIVSLQVVPAIQDSSAANGGAIYNAGTVSIDNTGSPPGIVQIGLGFNTATNQGGFLYNDSTGQATVNDSTLHTNNATNEGGAIYNNNGQLTVIDSFIYFSEAGGAGGGAIYNDSGILRLEGTTFQENTTATGINGGAIYNTNTSDAVIEAGNRFISNNGGGEGGAIYHETGSLDIFNNFFQSNNSGNQGGAIAVRDSEPRIYYNTFYNNTSNTNGEAIYASSTGNPDIINNIFDNHDTGFTTVEVDTPLTAKNDLQHNYFSNDDAGNPFNILLQPSPDTNLTDQPNPRFTDIGQNDLSVQSTSPVINQGLNINTSIVEFDWEGDPRIINGTADIGADEVNACLVKLIPISDIDPSPSANALPSVDATTLPEDGVIYGSIEQAMNAANPNDAILIAEGNCTENVVIDKNDIIVDGSWEKDFSAVLSIDGIRTVNTTIDADGTNCPVISGASNATNIRVGHLRLENGDAAANPAGCGNINGRSNGGGVSIPGNVNVVLDEVNIYDSTANFDGGGIYIGGGSSDANFVTVSIDTFMIGNRANQRGGGIYVGPFADVFIEGSVFDNTAVNGDGGGIYLDGVLDGTTAEVFATVSGNVSNNGNGGGLFIGDDSSVNTFSSSYSSNEAPGGNGGAVYMSPGSELYATGGAGMFNNKAINGGAIYANDATLELINYGIGSNLADGEAGDGDGGGIYITGANANATLINNIYESNHALEGDGGAIYRAGGGIVNLFHATIFANQASTTSSNANGRGDAIYNAGGTTVVSSTVIVNNFEGVLDGVEDAPPSVGNAYESAIFAAGGTVRVNRVLDHNNTLLSIQSGGSIVPGAGQERANLLETPPQFEGDTIFPSKNSPLVDAVNLINSPQISTIGYDAIQAFRPQVCDADIGALEYLVGERIIADGIAGPGSRILQPTETARYTFTLRNESKAYINGLLPVGTGYTETLNLTLDSTQLWARIDSITGEAGQFVIRDDTEFDALEPKAVVSLDSGATITVSVLVEVPAGAGADQEDLTTLNYAAETDCTLFGYPQRTVRNQPNGPQIEPAQPPNDSTASVQTSVFATSQFEIGPTYRVSAAPLEINVYTFTITNTGNIDDIYDLTTNANFYASAQIKGPSFVEIPSGERETVAMTITIRSDAGRDLTDITELVVTPRTNGSPRSGVVETTILPTNGIRYVTTGGTDNIVNESTFITTAVEVDDNSCLDRTTPCTTVGWALFQAEPTDEIRLGTGTYNENLVITKAVTIRGGFNASLDPTWSITAETYSQLDNPAIIDGTSTDQTVRVENISAVTLANLQLINGTGTDGGNLYSDGGTLTLDAVGISGGSATNGAGVYSAGPLVVQNSLIYDNSAATGAGVYAEDTLDVTNSTFYSNQGTDGRAIQIGASGLGRITNTIFSDHGNTSVIVDSSGTSTRISSNLFSNGLGSIITSGTIDNSFNIFGSALQFFSVASPSTPGEFDLTIASPARNAGLGTPVVFDYASRERAVVDTSGIDIGAYEYVIQTGLLFSPTTIITATDPGTNVVLTHYLTNTGEITAQLDLNVSQVQTWTVTITPTSVITLGPGEGQPIQIQVNVPTDGAGVIETITVTATQVSDPNTFAVVQDIVTGQFTPGLAFTPDNAATAAPNQPITFTHIITNTSNGVDTFNLSVDPAVPTVTIALTDSVQLAAGESRIITAVVTLPDVDEALANSSFDIRILAVSEYSQLNLLQEITATVINTISIDEVLDVVVQPGASDIGQPDTFVSYIHDVINRSNSDQTIDITASNSEGWTVSLGTTVEVLGPGETSSAFNVNVLIPAGTPDGTVATTTVTATLRSDPTVSDTLVNITTVAPAPSVEIFPTSDTDPVGIPTTSITYTYLVTNTGNGVGGFDIQVSADPSLAATVSLTETGLLAQNAAVPVVVTVTVPTVASDTVYAVVLEATSQLDPDVSEAVTNTLTVGLLRAVELFPTGLVGNGPSSTPVVYTHTLRNTGNGTDTFTVTTFNTEGWGVSVNPNTEITLAGGATQQLLVTVIVGAEDTADTIITATSTTDVSVFAVVTDTTDKGTFAVPTIISPLTGTITSTTAVELQWSAPSPAPPFYVVDFNGTRITTTSTTSATVLGEGVYTWTVASATGPAVADAENFADVQQFIVDLTPPTTPTLVAPANGSTALSDPVTFEWTASTDTSGIAAYTLVITGPAGVPTTYPVTGALTTTDITIGGADGIYTWTVRATDNGGLVSDAPTPFTFTLDASPPTAPVLLSPPNGTFTNTRDIVLAWEPVDEPFNAAVTYTVRLNNNPVDIMAPQVTSSTTNLGLSSGVVVYTWTVEAIDNQGRGAVSTVFSFTIDTKAPDAIPTLVSPPTNGGESNATVTFEWSVTSTADIDTYDLQIMQPNNTTITRSVTAGPSLNTTFNQLLTGGNGVYTWTVRSVDAAGNATAFASPSFTFTLTSPPAPVTLVSPIGGVFTRATNLTFNWLQSTGANTYTLVLTRNGVLSDTFSPIPGSDTELTINNIPEDIYAWNMEAFNVVGGSGFTDTQTFVVDRTAPPDPALVFPLTGEVVTQTEVVAGNQVPFQWTQTPDNVSGVVSYTIIITGPTPATVLEEVITGTEAVTVYNRALSGDGIYTWTLRAFDAAGNDSGFVTPQSFTVDLTPPLTPTLLMPPNGTVITDTQTVTFTWSNVGADSYNLRVTGGSPILSNTVGTSLVVTFAAQGTYQWSVEALDDVGNSSGFTDTWTFNLGGVPAAPPLVAPDNNLIISTTNSVTFQWLGVADALTYTLFIQGRAPEDFLGGSPSYVSTQTFADGSYTWTVRARNAVGASAITETRVFTIDTVNPTDPTLLLPADNDGVTDSTPTFTWTASTDIGGSGIDGYEVTIFDPLGGIVIQALVDDMTSYTSSLLLDGQYSWLVQAIDRAGNRSTNVTTNTFFIDTVAPNTPTQVYPISPTDVITSGIAPVVTFDWDITGETAGSSPITYTLVITDPTGTPRVIETTTDLSQFMQFDINIEGVYSWTVRATDAAGNQSAFAPVATFVVDTTPPSGGPPNLISPPDGDTIIDTNTVTFTWSSVADASAYRLWVAVENGPTVVLSDTANTSLTVNLSNQAYTWTVASLDDVGNATPFTDTWTFNLGELPAAPTLIEPNDGATITTDTVTFGWSDVDAIGYSLIITGPSGQTLNITDNGGPYSEVVGPLADGTYQWTVVATNTSGSTPSETRTFTIGTAVTVLNPPTLVSPPDGDIITSTQTVTFTWNAPTTGTTPSGYRVRVHVLNGATVVLSDTTALSLVIDFLPQDNYTWTVASLSGINEVVYTDTFQFTLGDILGAPDLIAPPDGVVTNATNINFSWTPANNATLYTLGLSGPGGLSETTDIGTSQTISSLSEGVYTWVVTATDGVDSTRSTSRTFTIDRTGPNAPVLGTPANGGSESETTVDFTWTEPTDALSSVVSYTIIITGPTGTVIEQTVTGTSTTIALTDGTGSYTWTLIAYDEVGNPSSPATPNIFTVDTSGPDAPILISPVDGLTTGATTITLTWESVTNATAYIVSLNGVTTTVTNTFSQVTLTDGPYTWSVQAVDGSGRTSPSSETRTFTIDTRAPSAITIEGPNSLLVNTVGRFTATATVSGIGLLTYTWEATDQATDTITTLAGQSTSIDYIWTSGGTKLITVTAFNEFGEVVGQKSVEVTFVPGAPQAVTIDNEPFGMVGSGYFATANVTPTDTITPLTYVWQVDEQTPITTTGASSLSDIQGPFVWNTPGTKRITVTVSNSIASVVGTSSIVIVQSPTSVEITGPFTGEVNTTYNFTATVSPITTTTPLTFVWQASDQSGSITQVVNSGVSTSVPYAWTTNGTKIITVTVFNVFGNSAAQDTFLFGIDVTGPASVQISGPTIGEPTIEYTYTATVSPTNTGLPLEYIWEATDQPTVIQGAVFSTVSSIPFTWSTVGTKTITVTVNSPVGTVLDTYTVFIGVQPPLTITISGPTAGQINEVYDYTVTVAPEAALPLTLVWYNGSMTPVTLTLTQANQLSQVFSATWATAGTKYLTATTFNAAGRITDTLAVTITNELELYLPIVMQGLTEDTGQAPTSVDITGPSTGEIGTAYTYRANVSPSNTDLPLQYVWEATDLPSVTQIGVSSTQSEVPFTWSTEGIKTIRVTVSNAEGSVVGIFTTDIAVTVIPDPDKPDLVIDSLTVDSCTAGTCNIEIVGRNQSDISVPFGNNFFITTYIFKRGTTVEYTGTDPEGNPFTLTIDDAYIDSFTNATLPDQTIEFLSASEAATRRVFIGVQATWFEAGASRTVDTPYTFTEGDGEYVVFAWIDPYQEALACGDSTEPIDLTTCAYNGTVDEDVETNNTARTDISIVGAASGVAPQNVQPSGPRATPTIAPN